MSTRHYLPQLLTCLSVIAFAGCGDSNPATTSDDGASSSSADSTADTTANAEEADQGTDDAGSTSTSATQTSGESTAGPDDNGSTGTDSDTETDSGESTDTGTPEGCGPPSEGGLAVEDFIPTAAQSTCDALFRCCDTVDLAAYFAPLLDNESLADLVDQLPPNAELTPEACPELMSQIMAVQPFGQWLEAVEAGYVAYDGVAAQACVDAMDAGDCSAALETSVTTALFDGTCLALDPPVGGDQQRRMFNRCSGTGDSCRRLNDGFGGLTYGTCNPNEAFCCLPVDGDPESCAFGNTTATEGTCVQVSGEGETCTIVPGFQWCATGVECVGTSCVAPPEPQPVGLGDTCVDADGFIIGDCTEGFCDFFESRCIALAEDGAQCLGGNECISGGCNGGECGAPTFCIAAD